MTPDSENLVLDAFPNPKTDWLFVHLSEAKIWENIKAMAFSATGQLAGAWQFDASETMPAIPFSHLRTGVCVLHFQAGSQEGRLVFLKAGQ